jgi:hypothetical protein
MKSMPKAPENIGLEQGLYGMDLKRLKAIAAHLSLDSSFASRARLLEEIPSALAGAKPDVLLDGLSRPDRYILMALVALEKTADMVGAAFFRTAEEELCTDTLANRGRRVTDKELGIHRIPAELVESIAGSLANSFKLKPSKRPETPFGLSLASAVLDLTTLWAELLKKPVCLTKTGMVSRRSLGRITPLMSVDEEEAPLYDVFAAANASRLDLFVNYALKNKMIARKGDELVSTWDQSETVMSDFPGLPTELLKVLVPGTGAAAALSLYVISEHPVGKWFRFSDLTRLAKRIGGESGIGTSGRVACALFVTGLLEAGFVNGELVLVRNTDITKTEAAKKTEKTRGFLVGGNFEVQVPADVSQGDRLKLEAFADLKAAGHYLTYVISRYSFYRALDDGLKPDEITGFLSECSVKELPQNLVFSLEDWAERYGVVGFVEGTFVVTDDADRLEEVENITRLVGTSGGPLKMYGFKIKPSDYEVIYERLNEAGYLPATLDAWKRKDGAPRFRLFRGDTARRPRAPRSTAVPPEEMLRSAVSFASEKGKRIRFYLSGGETVEGVPVRLSYKGVPSVKIEVGDDTVKIKAAEIEGFEFV